MKPYKWKQTDSRWARKSYKGMTLGAGGCGPTSIANVVSPLKRKKITPAKTWTYMCRKGYIIPGVGTLWAGITQTLQHYGVNKFMVTHNRERLRASLKRGYWCICSVGPSRWTTSGHYIAPYKLKGNGKVSISDPYSHTDYCQENASVAELQRAMKVGWIMINPKDYVRKKPKKAGKTIKEILYVDCARAIVRKGRGKKYGAKAVVKRGTKLTVTAFCSGWYRIAASKYKGYYISSSALSRLKPKKQKWKLLTDLNVRAGATTKAHVLRVLKRGTKAVSSKQLGDWVYIPAVKGWVRVKGKNGAYAERSN